LSGSHKLTKYISIGLLSFIVLLIPLFIRDRYVIGIFIVLLLNCSLAVSVFPILGTGLFTVAHGGFMAIGAYTATTLVMKLGLNCWLAMLVAGIVSIIVAVLLSFPTLRVKYLYFFLITFGFNEIIRLALGNWEWVGRTEGITDIPRPNIIIPGFINIDFRSVAHYYYLALFILLIITLVVHRLWSSQMRRIWQAIHINESLTQSTGIDVFKYKMLVFVIGCFFAGVLGAFYAYYYRFIAPSEFGLLTSMYPLFYVAIGGLGSISGALIGATVLTAIPEIFRFARIYQPMFFGAVLVIVMLFLPKGLMGLPERLKNVRLRMVNN
jgi:branched-chain amino acid transport system permease protein